jgi:hypothetical protein
MAGIPVALTVVAIGTGLAQAPGWWGQRGVTSEDPAADFSPANQGQLKWIAAQAREEMDAMLAELGGAGSNVAALVDGFSAANDYVPPNQGQLKYLAQPFYDRIATLAVVAPSLTNAYPEGVTPPYPWAPGTLDDADFAPVNVGQVKFVFSFDFDRDADEMPDWMSADSDGDGYADGLEIRLGSLANDPSSVPGIGAGLAGHWKYDEGEGTDTADSSGNGLSGKLDSFSGDLPEWVPGISGAALDFGSGWDHVVVNAYTKGTIHGLEEFTMAVWINPHGVHSLTRTFLRKEFVYGIGFAGWTTSHKMVFSGGNGTAWGDSVFGNHVFVEDEWRHVAVTFKDNTVRFYVDGELDATRTLNYSMPTNMNHMYFPYYWNGTMDDFRIYDWALKDTEIEAIYDLNADDDGDGMPNGWESEHGLARVYRAHQCILADCWPPPCRQSPATI